jgi:hypothetical protein
MVIVEKININDSRKMGQFFFLREWLNYCNCKIEDVFID